MKRAVLFRLVFLFALLPCAAVSGVPRGWAQTGGKPAASQAQLLDLNTASATDLKALPGIGDAYAKRIVDKRPYTAKNQLVTRGVLPQATYDKIKDQVVARHATK